MITKYKISDVIKMKEHSDDTYYLGWVIALIGNVYHIDWRVKRLHHVSCHISHIYHIKDVDNEPNISLYTDSLREE